MTETSSDRERELFASIEAYPLVFRDASRPVFDRRPCRVLAGDPAIQESVLVQFATGTTLVTRRSRLFVRRYA